MPKKNQKIITMGINKFCNIQFSVKTSLSIIDLY